MANVRNSPPPSSAVEGGEKAEVRLVGGGCKDAAEEREKGEREERRERRERLRSQRESRGEKRDRERRGRKEEKKRKIPTKKVLSCEKKMSSCCM